MTLLFLTFLCTCVSAQNPTPAADQDRPVVFRKATIHVGDGTVLEEMDILFDEGKIVTIEKDLPAPANADIMDATGKHIYPGMIALNTQLGLTEIGAVRSTNDQRETGRINPNARALIAFNTDSQVIPTVRSRGVLLAQITPVGGMVSGRSSMVQLDGWNFEDAVVGEDDGVHINWPRRNSWSWQTRTISENKEYPKQVAGLENFMKEAAAYCGAGRTGERLLKLEAMCEAIAGSKNVYLHMHGPREMMHAVQLVKKMGGKPVIVGGHESHLIADFLKREKVPVILMSTQSLPDSQDEGVDGPYAKPALLAEAGVEFAISHGGYWEQRNLPFVAGQAVGFGLDYEQAIKAVTLTPARIAGIDKMYGSLEEGKSATLIVTAGDVLDMRTNNIELAFIDGRKIDLDNKQAELSRKFMEKYRRGK
ncbi:amidohydrolase family protein [Neolewinella agarilytica]|uniref:amidohydrolase family protein n=1 Tax=Neolewinella agarilytica TaxID=478744 RepID=UPI001FE0849A|nr:amidohydrolase family protein [Neolewinella agarilytica]